MQIEWTIPEPCWKINVYCPEGFKKITPLVNYFIYFLSCFNMVIISKVISWMHDLTNLILYINKSTFLKRILYFPCKKTLSEQHHFWKIKGLQIQQNTAPIFRSFLLIKMRCISMGVVFKINLLIN